jgi:4a-hydroxytetrahydrobiopterin dehydratase
MPKVLSSTELARELSGLKDWKRKGKFISKTYQFDEFMDGIEFIQGVAKVAEKQEHHPDIHVRYTTVTLDIQTHSEGGVTEWDIDLAKAIERMRQAKGS